jgi:hypothetical protein
MKLAQIATETDRLILEEALSYHDFLISDGELIGSQRKMKINTTKVAAIQNRLDQLRLEPLRKVV